MQTIKRTLNLRAFALATLVPVVMMLVAMWMKPLWRDEYFSLYYSDPQESLSFLMGERWSIDAHPPFYNPFLWAWSFISEYPFWQKCLSLLLAGLGALLAFRLIRPEDKRHLQVFLLTCLGSYWIIYFATEIRPYVLNFTLSALLSLIGMRLYKDEKPGVWLWIGWLMIGIALSLTHYFGALWFACLGFVIGMMKLREKQQKSFAAIGLLTALGLIPVLFWIKFALGHMEFSGVATDASFWEKLGTGMHQFLRGLLIKTFGSNPLITLLGAGGLLAAILGRRRDHAVLLWAAILTVLCAFILHTVYIDMIKERAFIVIMPAILWILSGQLSETRNPLAKIVPVITAIMPFLFISEYFKNKEEIPELLAAIDSYGPACESPDLFFYLRPDPPEDFYYWATQKLFDPDADRELQPMGHFQDRGDPCPVLAVAILLPKSDVAPLTPADLYDLETRIFGKGRSVLWVRKNPQISRINHR